ncbi:MAG: hypothetical protein HYR96_08445 [Deltaproteobacteria bacterium]|nr:hypothetical protein [Deltaproteobacteria bacterium]MBI3295689.1 hypothetical protein [Deltaproteobacteria bacterium]
MRKALVFTFIALFAFGVNATESLERIEDEIFDELPEEFELLGPEVFHALIEYLGDQNLATSDSPAVCTARLTLTSGTAITTSDVTAATTIYFTPYEGALCSLYSGAIWQLVSFSETSVAVPSTTTTPFDIFAYNNSGILTLETLDWTNDTTRATALTTQNGTLVKTGDATRRYLGTGRTTGVSGQTEDSTSKRFLWNMYNRVPRKLMAYYNVQNFDNTSTSWKSLNGVTTTGLTRIEFVLGQSIEPVRLSASIPQVGSAAGDYATGVGINSTSANSADLYGGASNASYPWVLSHYMNFPSVGFSYGQMLDVESSNPRAYLYYDSGGIQLKDALYGKVWS